MIFIDGIIYSLQTYGGISVYQYEILKRLRLGSIDFKFFMPNETISNISNEILSVCDNKVIFKSRYLERFRKAVIDKNASGNDVFHSTYYRTPSNKKTKNVVTLHDFTYERFSSGLRKNIHWFQKSSALKSADKIICISQNTMYDLSFFMGDKITEKASVIYNGVSSDYFVVDSSTNKKPQILFVGSRTNYKCFRDAVFALAPIKEFNLVIIGGGVISVEEKKLLEAVLPNRYEHIAFVDNIKLNQLYNESLCLLYPSLYEGFGIPPLEAMKAGCVPLVRNVSSLPEVVGSAGLLARTNEIDELTYFLYKLFDSEFLKERISAGLIQANKFSWDRCYLETKDIYTSF